MSGFFSEKFPGLAARYNANNLEKILSTIVHYFSDILKLAALDILAARNSNSKTLALLDDLVRVCEGLHTEKELNEKIQDWLLTDTFNKSLRRLNILPPHTTSGSSKQIGFLEQLAVGSIPVAQPLSYLDMRRAVEGLLEFNKNNKQPQWQVQVLSLKSLLDLSEEKRKAITANNHALVINLELDLEQPAKWSLLQFDPSKKTWLLFCESTLSESEKKQLQSLYQEAFNYSGMTASSVVTSGYKTLAKLDKGLLKAWNFDPRANFASQVANFLVCQFAGDHPLVDGAPAGFAYEAPTAEDEALFTTEFKYLLGLQAKEKDGKICLARRLCLMSNLAAMGKINNDSFSQGDLSRLLNIASTKQLSWEQLNALEVASLQSRIIRLDATISQPAIGFLKEKGDTITLAIPQAIKTQQLHDKHYETCVTNNSNNQHLLRDKEPNYYRLAFIYTLLRNRFEAKTIELNLPADISFTIDEQNYLVDSFSNNPYICKLRSTGQGKLPFLDRLIPIISRNQWLAFNGYKPPLSADFWQQAAKYWLYYAQEHHDLLSNQSRHAQFYSHSEYMGAEGLAEVLKYLKSPQGRQKIEGLYGAKKPGFYARSKAENQERTLQLLNEHLQGNHYFPFSEVEFSYDTRQDALVLSLIENFNKLEQIDDLYLHVAFSTKDKAVTEQNLETFLESLLKKAKDKHWTQRITLLPNQGFSFNASIDRKLAELNAVLIENYRSQKAKAILGPILASGSFDLPKAHDAKDTKSPAELFKSSFRAHVRSIDELDDRETFPLEQDGALKLQLQNQLQIEQTHVPVKKVKPVRIRQVREPLDTLISYANIEEKLADVLENFKADGYPLHEQAARLKSPAETLLQGFFHSFISANPDNKAAKIIHYMTPKAAIKLLHAHQQLSSGLNPDNLPQNFYLQEAADGRLVLCYKASLGFVAEPNPLTLNLDSRATPAEIMVERANQRAIIRIFEEQVDPLKTWSKDRFAKNEAILSALAQLNYKLGKESLRLLLTKFYQMEQDLGCEFFESIISNLLNKTPHFIDFYEQKENNFFERMDQMRAALKDNPQQKQAFQDLLAKHLEASGWDKLEEVWAGFSYFLEELSYLDLKLQAEDFKNIPAGNAFILLDRVLSCLKSIPRKDMQESFLRNLADYDLSQGGILYALQHNWFKVFSSELELRDFSKALNGYAPSLADIFSWNETDAALYIKRTLASSVQFSYEDYAVFSKKLDGSLLSRYQLILLMHTQHEEDSPEKALQKIERLSESFIEQIAKHVQMAVYSFDNHHPKIRLDSILALAARKQELSDILQRFPQASFLECYSLLHQQNADEQQIQTTLSLFNDNKGTISDKKNPLNSLQQHIFQIATLFSLDNTKLQELQNTLKNAKPSVVEELDLLFKQLLSINFQTSQHIDQLAELSNFKGLLNCVEDMKLRPEEPAFARIAFMQELHDEGIRFKYSSTGDSQTLQEEDLDTLTELGFFVEHQQSLRNFLRQHIVVHPKNKQESLARLMHFFRRLQLNRSYLNEVAFVLFELEKTPVGAYWNCDYFCQLLEHLLPSEKQPSFPIAMLKVLIQDERMAAKEINSLNESFPAELFEQIQPILHSSIFDRQQQATLTEICLREYSKTGKISQLPTIIEMLGLDEQASNRSFCLDLLKQSNELDIDVDDFSWILGQEYPWSQPSNWAEISRLWLELLSSSTKPVRELFNLIKYECAGDEDKQALLLFIIAKSCLNQGLRNSKSYQYELEHKSEKLLSRLKDLDISDLKSIAQSYENRQTGPAAEALLTILKAQGSLAQKLENFKKEPYSKAWFDFGAITKSREADFERMLEETRLDEEELTPAQKDRIKNVFTELKNFEQNITLINNNKLSELSDQELAEAFHAASCEVKNYPTDDRLQARLFAILFNALGRTTNKYPHLAQQFAVIAYTVCIGPNSGLLELATGEGKSFFSAIRNALNAGMGFDVDAVSLKRNLSSRDMAEYNDFYALLGIPAGIISQDLDGKTYEAQKIHHGTLGDISLGLVGLQYEGQALAIDPSKRVANLDEVDAVFNDPTQFNFAEPTGKTPKQMHWLYQSLNNFLKQKIGAKKQVSKADFIKLKTLLLEQAADHAERRDFVNHMFADHRTALRWLRSTKAVHSRIQRNIDFAVSKEERQIQGETYSLREMLPINAENQLNPEATFSDDMHQLLASFLNDCAKEAKDEQNFHVHPQSSIISTQTVEYVLEHNYGRIEGASATIPKAQAKLFKDRYGCSTLRVPSNRRDLRTFEDALFYKDRDSFVEAVAKRLQACFTANSSPLLSCKNDKETQDLIRDFRERKLLSEAELNQLVSYINEDKKTAAAVVKEKESKECWEKGQKTKAAALVASCFKRGDNVGADAVFIFHVQSQSEKWQMAGRTGRNGQPGTVIQMYLVDDLQQEEQALLDNIRKFGGEDLSVTLAEVEGSSEEEKLFERILFLKEYLGQLQNQVNAAYGYALSQCSNWIMGILGKTSNKLARAELTHFYRLWREELERSCQAEINKPQTTPREKIQEIERITGAELIKLCAWYNAAYEANVVPCNFKPYRFMQLPAILSKFKINKDLDAVRAQIAETLKAQLNPVNPEWIASLAENSQYPEKILPMFHMVEAWMLLQEEPTELFQDFSAVLVRFIDDMDLLSELISLCNSWWKKQHNKYQADLAELWSLLANLEGECPELATFLRFCFEQGGKAAFNIALAALKSMSKVQRAQYLSNLEAVWGLVDSMEVKKFEKIALFEQFCRLLLALEEIDPNFYNLFSKDQILDYLVVALPYAGYKGLLEYFLSKCKAEPSELKTELRAFMQQCLQLESKLTRLEAPLAEKLFASGVSPRRFCFAMSQTDTNLQKCQTQPENYDHWLEFVLHSGFEDAELEEFAKLLMDKLDSEHSGHVLKQMQRLSVAGISKDLYSELRKLINLDLRPSEFTAYLDTLLSARPESIAVHKVHFRLLEKLSNIAKKPGPQGDAVRTNENALVRIIIAAKNKPESEALMVEILEEAETDNPPLLATLTPASFKELERTKPEERGVFRQILSKIPTELLSKLPEAVLAYLKQQSMERLETLLPVLAAIYQNFSSPDESLVIHVLELANGCNPEQLPILNRYIEAKNSELLSKMTIPVLEKLRFNLLGTLFEPFYRHLPEGNHDLLIALLRLALDADADKLQLITGLIEAKKIAILGCLSNEILKSLLRNPEKGIESLDLILERIPDSSEAFLLQMLDLSLGSCSEGDKLATLRRLIRPENRRLLEHLTVNLVSFLAPKKDTALFDDLISVIDLFDSIAFSDNSASPFNNPELTAVFDFTNTNPVIYRKRIIWMSLLKQQVLLSPEWRVSQNTHYLAQSNQAYLNRAIELLNPGTNIAARQRALFLSLGDELENLDRMRQGTELAFAGNTELQTELTELIQNYSNQKKSGNRSMHAAICANNIHRLFKNPVSHPYELLLKEISQAKIRSMKADLITNRNALWKTNRGGESRFIKTLDAMRDLIIRHWATDKQDFTSAHKYKQVLQSECADLSVIFNQALEDYYGPGKHLLNKTAITVESSIELVQNNKEALPGHLKVVADEWLESVAALNEYKLVSENSPQRSLINY